MKKLFEKIFIIVVMQSTLLVISCNKVTPPTLPIITTSPVKEISYTSATSGGDLINEGGATIISRGICWSTSNNPTIMNSKTTESGGLGIFTSKLTQLAPNSVYFVRAYATNEVGTGYGDQQSFNTPPAEVPVLTTTVIGSIDSKSAVSGGNIIDDKGGNVMTRGVCWSTEANPTITNNKTNDGAGTGSYSSSITGLIPNTKYYVRAYAINSIGTAYGEQLNFTTLAELPSITTTTITGISTNSAISGGMITSDGGANVTAYGICWSIIANPTISNSKTTDGSGIGSFISNITNLIPNTTYFVRAYATNIAGTKYGNELSFKTFTSTVTDIDGNLYLTVTIGTQIWIAENLKTTKYKDGTPILNVTDGATWSNLGSAAYSWYNNDAVSYKSPYGALYNWYACNTGILCPTGWHIPNDPEWTILTTFLGSGDIAGRKLKEAGSTHWPAPNTEATNETGFTLLPGGARFKDGSFANLGRDGIWWSSTEFSPLEAECRSMENVDLHGGHPYKTNGFSVRCLKD